MNNTAPQLDAETLDILTSRPAPATTDELAALRRLIRVAQSNTGQSRRCAAFLLAWWNADTCGGFDLTDLWAVDTSLANDMLAVAGLVARHNVYPDTYEPRRIFVELVGQWRPHLMTKDDNTTPAADTVRTFYTVPDPYSSTRTIEVYGDGEMGWYEWRIVEHGKTLQDTKERGYGSPEFALRDALIAVSE